MTRGPLPSLYDGNQLEEIAAAVGHGLTASTLFQYRDRLVQAAFWVRPSTEQRSLIPGRDLEGQLETLGSACDRFAQHARILIGSERRTGPARNVYRDLEAAAAAVKFRLGGRTRGFEDGLPNRDLASRLAEATEIDDAPLRRFAERIAGYRTDLLSALAAAEDLSGRASRALHKLGNFRRITTTKGHSGDPGLNDWIAEMMDIYFRATGRPPVPGTKGPLVRFLSACGQIVGLEMSDLAWNRRTKRTPNARKKS